MHPFRISLTAVSDELDASWLSTGQCQVDGQHIQSGAPCTSPNSFFKSTTL
jgi:hypothetical protein